MLSSELKMITFFVLLGRVFEGGQHLVDVEPACGTHKLLLKKQVSTTRKKGVFKPDYNLAAGDLCFTFGNQL